MVSRKRRLIPLLLAALLLSSLRFATPAQARTLTVCPIDCDFSTIVAALQAADDGDSIDIGEGTYAGDVVVEKDVTLRGAGRAATTIQGTNRASVIRVRAGVDVVIEDLAITGGGGSRIGANAIGGGGILNEGRLTLHGVTVRDNTVASSGSRVRLGGGIYSESAKSLKILDSHIAGNRAFRGGGIFVGDGDAVIQGTTISGNQVGSDGGGIRYEGSETLRVENSTITDNRAGGLGGGVSAASELRLIGSTVAGNTAGGGGGISGGGKALSIERSLISGNTATVSAVGGGGIFVGRGGLILVGSTVEKNQSLVGAGIFSAFSSGEIDTIGSTIRQNIATADGGGIWTQSAEINLASSQVIDNQAGERGGGIFVRAADPEVRLHSGTVVARNQPDQCFPAELKC